MPNQPASSKPCPATSNAAPCSHTMDTKRSINITRVIDGDTVEIRTKPGLFRKSRRDRIRLYGIDAPESAQKGGSQSTKHLSKIIGSGKNVWIQTSGTDQYGRLIGLLYHHHGDPEYSYNYQMIEAGHAHCYMASRSDRSRFLKAQQDAREHRRGLWNQSNPTPPWEWRKTHTQKTSILPWKWIIILAAAAIILWLAPCAGDITTPFR